MDGQPKPLKLASNRGGGRATASPPPTPPPLPAPESPAPALSAPPPPPAFPGPGGGSASLVSSHEPPHARSYQREYRPASAGKGGRQPSARPAPAPRTMPAPPPAVSPASGGGGVKDLGVIGTGLVWLFALALFGAPLAGWFYCIDEVQAQATAWLGSLEVPTEGGPMELAYLDYLDNLGQINELMLDQERLAELDRRHLDEWGAPQSSEEDPRRRFSGWSAGWPALEMSGTIVGARPEAGSVILDGDVVGVGQEYRGVRVIQVRSDSAELEYDGRRRWIMSGQMINQ